jgi:hypothetical protein
LEEGSGRAYEKCAEVRCMGLLFVASVQQNKVKTKINRIAKTEHTSLVLERVLCISGRQPK